MERDKKQPFRPIWAAGVFFLLGLLACGVSLPSRDQVESGLATAQSFGEQAVEMATGAAPTLQALQTQAVDLATGAAPSVEVGLEKLATISVRAQDSGVNARATLDAAGIDGNYLRAKVMGLRPDGNGNINLTITETEINLILQANLLLAAVGTEPVAAQMAEVNMTGGEVVFTGQITIPVEGNLMVRMRPEVADGKIDFIVTAANLDGNAVPPALLGTIGGTLNTAVNTAIDSIPGGVVLKDVVVREGAMTLVAGR